VALHLAGPALAFGHQSEYQHQRNQQQQDEEGDQEELERRAARQALNGAEQLLHLPLSRSSPPQRKSQAWRRQLLGGRATEIARLRVFIRRCRNLPAASIPSPAFSTPLPSGG